MNLKIASAIVIISVAATVPVFAESIGAKEAEAINGNVFAKADTDKDGKLSSQEFYAIVKHHFKKADKNGDGVVDDEELGAQEANALIQLKEF